jgi:hypothetical protein
MVRTDREVLTVRARQYLESYTGDFHVLIEARRQLAEGYELNIAQVRTVLNAMRADTSVRFDYTPPAGTNVIQFPAPQQRGVSFEVDDEKYPSHRRFMEEYVPREPRWRRHKKFKLKLPYAMATAARSEVLHLISQERSELTYYPVGSWHNGEKVFGQPLWEFRLYYECTQASKKLRMLTEHEAAVLENLGLMRYCRTCQQFRDFRG